MKVGDVGIGGRNPIRIQSMTIADTMDTDGVVQEIQHLVAAGCEIVRLTAPSIKEAENLRQIKKKLRQMGIRVPLVADIHYTPNAALVAAEIVEKVRINPGNYADKKKFEIKEYTDAEYEAELARVYDRFAPLVKKCKENGVAMRIGVNHGSLSDRITNRYGDTPEGMVESALEFIRICEDFGYRDLVVSMKSSNPQVMIHAYRLLAARMYELGMTYPFHLGVTEAGEGEDGRIKSAVGIGALLEDGIGDTIRVSLTEDAVQEIPVARALVEKFNRLRSRPNVERPLVSEEDFLLHFPPFETVRRPGYLISVDPASIGGQEPVRVLVSSSERSNGRELRVIDDQPEEKRPEWIVCEQADDPADTYARWVPVVHPCDEAASVLYLNLRIDGDAAPAADKVQEMMLQARRSQKPVFVHVQGFAPGRFKPQYLQQAFEALKPHSKGRNRQKMVVALEVPANHVGGVGNIRQALGLLAQYRIDAPIVFSYTVPAGNPNWQLDAASVMGGFLCDGIGSGIYIRGAVSREEAVRFSYTLLQATRLRISRTEFISCPSCGRTLFDLQTTTERIKAKTGHLKGVKIAIMGCIVNGPGEMADADFGYVGSGPGKVNLFVGKECVERNIPEEEADSRLIELIRRHGKWRDPENGGLS